jgi:extracellular factor (EF) 3-hydroxypalmitic acid methyl ester biosynthesis protein
MTMELLDRAHERINDGDVFDGMEQLLVSLSNRRREMPAASWMDWCRDDVRVHPIFQQVQQSPLTRRAFEKPRGYPGDAATLDFLYGIEPLPASVSPLGRQLYAWEFQCPNSRSVRARKELLAARIDQVCARIARPRVLSLACGHVREARSADAVLDRRLDAFFAIDQDAASLAVVAQELSPFGVTPVQGSVRAVLARKLRYRDIDLAYAAGLFDYLAHPVAAQLTARLFGMLRSGGQLLIPNFVDSAADVAYMEAFLDWQLIYRDEDELLSLASLLPREELGSVEVFREKHGNVCVLEITRR